jgi:hypothetical protein
MNCPFALSANRLDAACAVSDVGEKINGEWHAVPGQREPSLDCEIAEAFLLHPASRGLWTQNCMMNFQASGASQLID